MGPYCVRRLRKKPLPADGDRQTTMKIGVLALQGDFDAHRKRLEELGAEVVLVKKPEQFDGIDGLLIPGGESGTFLKLLGEGGFEKLKQFVRLKPTFGTCAGAILLATEVENPKQAGLGAVDVLHSPGTPTAARSTAPFAKENLETPRWKWYSSARRKLSMWVQELKSSRPRAAIQSLSVRAQSWRNLPS